MTGNPFGGLLESGNWLKTEFLLNFAGLLGFEKLPKSESFLNRGGVN